MSTVLSSSPLARARHLVAVAALLAPLFAPGAAAAAVHCTDFLAQPDNLPMPETFKKGPFRFRDFPGNYAPIINVFTDLIGQPVHGLQFDGKGLRVTLRQPASQVELRIGAFAPSGLKIRALDGLGGVQDVALVPADLIMHTVTLAATSAGIVQLRITGGGNEGVVNWVCATP